MKSRDLSLLDYLHVLQQEYIVAELRQLIYKPNYYEYCSKVMKSKKVKINNIAKRNNLRTIFNTPEVYERIKLEVYGSCGFPTFTYRDEMDRAKSEKRDFYRYYRQESDVRISSDQYDSVGVVDNADFDRKVVTVKVNGVCIEYPCDQVSRVF